MKCASFYLKMRQNVFGGRAPPSPAGELTALPQRLAGLMGTIRGGNGNGNVTEGKDRREEREIGTQIETEKIRT